MKIQVSFGTGSTYTYAIDADVAVGDTVVTPPPWWNTASGPREAEVVAIGSDYDGPLARAWLPAPQERAAAGDGVDQVLSDQQRDGAADGAGSQPGLLGDLSQRRED